MQIIQETTKFNPVEVKVLVETQEEYNDLIGYIKNYGPKPVSSGNQTDSDGWISNIGNDTWTWPEGYGIDANTCVKIKRRDGSYREGCAGYWEPSWCEVDGEELDIVEFRIVK